MNMKKRGLSFLLAIVMVFASLSGAPIAVAADPPQSDALALHYDFANDEGSSVKDTTENGYDGTLMVSGSGSAALEADTNLGGGQALNLTRGSAGQQGGYISIPAQAFAQTEDGITFSVWIKVRDNANWSQLLSMGTDPLPPPRSRLCTWTVPMPS